MNKYFLILILLTTTPAYAFNWKKCKKLYKPSKFKIGKGNWGEQIVEYSVHYTTERSVEASSSTTSYVSSTGECKAFAKAEEERLRYIAETMTELQMEAAEGQGEHVSSLASLYGCNDRAKNHFNSVIKFNHSKIFSHSQKTDSSEVTNKITEAVVESDILSKNCNLELI